MINTTVELITTPYHVNNRPDSIALLRSSATAISRFSIDCLPLTGPITIIVSKSDATNIDTASYAILKYDGDVNTYLAFVRSRVPVSPDAYSLTLQCDGLLTCITKGITKLEGVTERVHVPKSSDTLGAYVEDDPYLGCAQPLEIESEMKYTGANYDGTDSVTIVAATFDIFELSSSTEALEFMNTGSAETVSVPDIPALRHTGNDTKKQLVTIPISDGSTTINKSVVSPAIDYFDGENDPNNNGVCKGMSVAHSLGASDGIVAQYTVPKGFLGYGSTIYKNSGRLSDTQSGDYKLVGKHDESLSTLPFVHTSNIQNNRLFVGDMNKYGLTAVASGENAEFRPEDIMKTASDTITSAPYVELYTDPRENGMPSYKFKYINKSHDMFRGLIKGLQWQNVPLVNSLKEGYGIEKFKFMNDGILQEQALNDRQSKALVGLGTGMLGGAGEVSMGSERMQGMGGLSILNSVGQYVQKTANNLIDLNYAEMARQVEANELVVSNKLVAPNMKFNFHPSIRDAIGNGVCVYRYKPSSADMARLDKILNMYGYRVTKMLELSDFSNRSRYNYIKASGVHITCQLPSYIVEQAEADLRAGVRLWHVAYDGNYATVNS